MKMHTITVELDARDVTTDQADQLMTNLEQLHPAVSTSPRGWLAATVTIPAEHVGQAVTLAIAAVEQAAGHPAIAVTAMTEEEADAREGWDTPSELVSVGEAAEILGVTRQAVLDRISRHTLPATKVGRGYTIPRAAVVKAAADKHRPSIVEQLAGMAEMAEKTGEREQLERFSGWSTSKKS